VLITKFDHDPSRAVGSARHKRCSWPIGARQEQWLRAPPQATAAQAATLAPRPPFNARVETVTTKPFFSDRTVGTTDIPGPSATSFGKLCMMSLTGTHCTILTKLPVAFWAGSSENAVPDPG
jgi:hypothetical protein